MALQFYFGASGSGKSTQIQKKIIEWAREDRTADFLMIVPDQFTMQTQKQMAERHPDGGILNIDVLSFGRLSHRVFEEVGKDDRLILDDTGKCLLLRKVVYEHKEELPTLAKGFHNPGYIQEVKSVLSEFMQYGITPKDVEMLWEYAESKKGLACKLKDLQKVYSAFLKECANRFITKEETLDLLTQRLHLSDIIRQSVIVFDGFTGFTPIQNKVIIELLHCAKDVYITLPMDNRCSPYHMDAEDFLFWLSQKTVLSLQKLAMKEKILIREDVFLPQQPVFRFRENAEMAHLESNLFRDIEFPYEQIPKNIEIVQAGSISDECAKMCERMFALITKEKYRYRDIAIVTGDMNAYEDALKMQFYKYNIPYFMDTTSSLLLNPFVEFIRGSMRILLYDFQYSDVFHFLRTGFGGQSMEQMDRLENYVRARGVKGYRKWKEKFIFPSRELKADAEGMAMVDECRAQLVGMFAPFYDKNDRLLMKRPAAQWVQLFYDFIVKADLEKKLAEFASYFESCNDLTKAKEYQQIYRLTMDLLDQIISLLDQEELSLQEFCDICDAGFAEIRVGTIPQSVDILVVGDIERTRLKEIKALFFLGVNDGNIPKGGKPGGIISDIEKEFLLQSGKELSPTPKEQMYIQRLYLYLNLTKPSQQLYLSYASVSEDGNSLRPSYLINTCMKLFPKLQIQCMPKEDKILSMEDAKERMAVWLREYASGLLSKEDEDKFLALYGELSFDEQSSKWLQDYVEAAFSNYQPTRLERELAQKLYGKIMECSISSLERFASCEYAHFLAYGLKLKEREEYGFENVDLGNVTHEILEKYGNVLSERKIDWCGIDMEQSNQILDEVINEVAAQYKGALLYEGARNRVFIEQLKRIMQRTIKTLTLQLKSGEFRPSLYERTFQNSYTYNEASLSNEQMILKGKIDRIDLCADKDDLYVKVVDYKSGNKKFDATMLYYGITLQLAVYLGQALSILTKQNPGKNIYPAAMLYYKISDPILSIEKRLSKEELEQKMLAELNNTGVVSNRGSIVEKLDASFVSKSDVIPVKRDKNGEIKEDKSAMNPIFLDKVLSFAKEKSIELATQIMQGNIEMNPYETKDTSACTFCAYASSCGFDEKKEGFRKRELILDGEEEIKRKGGEE